MKPRHPALALAAIAVLLSAFQFFSLSAFSQNLSPADVKVTITCARGDAAPRTAVQITDAKPEGQYVRASVTNDSAKDITLNRLVVTLPWPRLFTYPFGPETTSLDAQICAGIWEMGRSTTQIYPADTSAKPETGSYLLGRSDLGTTLAGFVTWKTFHSKLRWEKDTLVIDADGEGRILKPGETVQTEKVWLVQINNGGNVVADAFSKLIWENGTITAVDTNGKKRLVAGEADNDRVPLSSSIDANGEMHVMVGGTGKTGETVELAKARLTPTADWQDLLFSLADNIAAENAIHLKPARAFAGWGTWDYYGRDFTSDQVAANIAKLAEICPQANIVQIDAGWWPLRGDYTQLRADLQPDGMKRIASLARATLQPRAPDAPASATGASTSQAREQDAPATTAAGIHLDGWRADTAAEVTRAHPDWFLHDAAGKLLVQRKTASSECDTAFFDYSNPAARDFIKNALQQIRREWGYDYFKMDFIRYGTNEFIRTGLDKKQRDTAAIVPGDRALTSIERLHLSLAAMREGMGADAFFLGCSAVFGPAYGHVDGLRTGADIAPTFKQFKRCALNNIGSFHLNGKVVWNDTDYIVVRAAADQDATLVKNPGKDGGDLALNEAWMWTHYVALCGGPRINSDNLLTLRPERLALFQFAAAFPPAARFVPLDLWAHAREAGDPPAVILSQNKDGLHLGLFNWTDAKKTLILAGIPAAQLAQLSTVSNPDAIATMKTAGTTLTITLPARHSTILKLPNAAPADFDALRHAITVK